MSFRMAIVAFLLMAVFIDLEDWEIERIWKMSV